MKSQSLILALVLAAMISLPARAQYGNKPESDKYIAVLKSEAELKDKSDACRELGRVGTKEAIPVLAALLADEKLSHMARYGLEPIPDPAVDDAFRAALPKVSGRVKIGVITSLGFRRDVKAIEPLAALLKDADAQVASAAAVALGWIGTPEAKKAIEAVLTTAPEAIQAGVYDGALKCADVLMQEGKAAEAIALFDQIRGKQFPPHIRLAGTRGAILARGEAGIPLMVETIRGDDPNLFNAVLRVALELKGPKVTAALADELAKAPAHRQTALIETLCIRGDAAAGPAVVGLVKSTDKAVKIKAIQGVSRLKEASAVPLLLQLTADADGQIADAAKASLVTIPGAEADKAILSILAKDDAASKRAGIDLVARRRVLDAVPALQKLAGDADEGIRQDAIKALGDLVSAEQIGVLIDLLNQAKSAQDIEAATTALSAVATRADDAAADKLIAALAKAQPPQRRALIRALGAMRGPKVLAAVRGALKDTDPQVVDAAVRAICDWPGKDVAADLLAIAKDSENGTHRVLALRSYTKLTKERGMQPAQKLQMCKEMLALAKKDPEKKVVLSALSDVQHPESLKMVMSMYDEAGVREEAGAAAVTIAEKILAGQPKLVAESMEKVAAGTRNADLANRAKALLADAKKKLPK